MTGIYAPDGSQNVTVVGGDLATAIGNPDDEAWNGTDESASLIAIQKAIYAAVSA
jgi:hypothetical protein